MASPVTPWARSSQAKSPRTSGAPFTGSPAFRTGLFENHASHTHSRSGANTSIQVDRPPIPFPLMGRSAALRLSRRAELLDKRLNVHVRSTTESRPDDHLTPELEGTTPVIAELEGSGLVLPELEGSTPNTYNAVEARVFPASAVKTVDVKPKRTSRKLFSLRPEKTHYNVACTNAAAEVAQAEQEMKERRSFADKINACRKGQKLSPLKWDDDLSSHAQHHADNLPSPHDPTVPSPTGPFTRPSPLPPRPDTVTSVRSPLDGRPTVARIISDRGLGAMACVERWYSGKHRRHAVQLVHKERHQEDCPCRLEIVYGTMMSGSFGKIGVGRATEAGAGGVWVVELAA